MDAHMELTQVQFTAIFMEKNLKEVISEFSPLRGNNHLKKKKKV